MTATQQHFLILGGTGSIGYAFAQEALRHQAQVTLLVRDRQKALALFGEQPNLRLVTGDANDLPLLQDLAGAATHIFHGINYPYPQWADNMERVTRHVISAAEVSQATILFPGNIYNYGLTSPILETSEERPCSRKGAIRVQLEQLLRTATAKGRCRVVVLRLPDFWGPNVLNEGIAPIFRGALAGKPMPWLCRNDIPHQLVYTPDAARVFWQLVQAPPAEAFALYNFAGEVVPSIQQWQAQIAAAAGTKPKYKLYRKSLFRALGWFMPDMREIYEMRYLWDNTLLLQDDKLRRTLPHLTHTPMPQAITETLGWFRAHDPKI